MSMMAIFSMTGEEPVYYGVVQKIMDVCERLFAEDMMQSSVVLASLVYHAAMRKEKLPRVWPLPWQDD